MKRKGVLLAGGAGTRLYPATFSISKLLLPVFDKPMIYYSLTTLMLAGIREILLVSTARDLAYFHELLQDGSQWGLELSYVTQPAPKGIAQAFILSETFLNRASPVLILGDNIFHGRDLKRILSQANQRTQGASVFAYAVEDPKHYGVVQIDEKGKAISIEEKPHFPKSQYALTGLYFYDEEAIDLAKTVQPSARGEYEISDLNQLYLEQGNLHVDRLGADFVWLDAGTHASMLEASHFVCAMEQRQGFKIACPEEIAWRQNWITDEQLEKLAYDFRKSDYGRYLMRLLIKESVY